MRSRPDRPARSEGAVRPAAAGTRGLATRFGAVVAVTLAAAATTWPAAAQSVRVIGAVPAAGAAVGGSAGRAPSASIKATWAVAPQLAAGPAGGGAAGAPREAEAAPAATRSTAMRGGSDGVMAAGADGGAVVGSTPTAAAGLLEGRLGRWPVVRRIVFVPVPVIDAALVPLADIPGAYAAGADPRECEEVRRTDPSRLPWGLGWLYRYGRDVDLERSASTPFSFYLRSPLLSGLQDARGCPRPGTPDGDEDCAIVTVRTGVDQEITLEVPLPQLEARNVRRLRTGLRDRLERGEPVRLLTTEGEDIEIQPGAAREIDARACRA
jgi:hypothetical protein